MNELDWLTRLLAEFERVQPRLARLHRYRTNRPDLPEMGRDLEKAWERFQREAATNWAGMIVDELAERIIPNAITVADQPEVENRAREIWRNNRLDMLVPDMIRDQFGLGAGYLMTTRSEDGTAQITHESPTQVVTLMDPVQTWKPVAALKTWRDTFKGLDYAYVWHDGHRVTWERDSKDAGGVLRGLDVPNPSLTPATSWRLVPGSRISEPVPVRRFENRGGVAEFEEHIPLIDRINRGVLNRLVISSMQAFKQRALTADKDSGGLPTHDEHGNEVDYSEVFTPAPGALWELPPGVGIWESSSADLHQLIAAETADIKHLSASSRTPLATFLPDSVNQSATGAEAARDGLVAKARDRIKRLKPDLEGLLLDALRIEGYQVTGTIKVEFAPENLVTMAEKYDAAVKAHAIGESVESIQRNILGYSQPQIEADRVARARDTLSVLTATGQ